MNSESVREHSPNGQEVQGQTLANATNYEWAYEVVEEPELGHIRLLRPAMIVKTGRGVRIYRAVGRMKSTV